MPVVTMTKTMQVSRTFSDSYNKVYKCNVVVMTMTTICNMYKYHVHVVTVTTKSTSAMYM